MLSKVEGLMAMLERLQEYLDQNRVTYTHTAHPLAYTAREVAAAEHLPAREVAKAVIFLGDNGYRMAVLPANRLLDFQELRTVLGFTHARLATEQELAQLFPDCELGAMPPFGNLYGIPVYLDSSLLDDEMIAFNAGTHRDVIHMRIMDFRRLTEPGLVSLSRALARHA
jgi:Ala-tRNA(Pro) deacylase